MTLIKTKKRSTDLTFNSTTTNSGPTSKRWKKKRVSFATSVEEKQVLDGEPPPPTNHTEENGHFQAEGMDEEQMKKPKKGILKKKSAQTSSNDDKASLKKGKSKAEQRGEGKKQHKNFEKGTKNGVRGPTNKKMRTIKIRRSTKEVLMNLGKKERREFIRQLEAANKPNYELVRKAKLLWEVIRNSKTVEEKREQFVQELLNMCTGKLVKLVYSHSTCRVVQCLVALKKPKIREQIFDELSPEVLRMAKSKYANYLVAKMLKYGSKNQRDIVINAFRGHCVDLFRVSHSVNVLEDVYNEWATAEQRHSIVAEFYGNEFDFIRKEQNLPNSQLNIEAISRNFPEKMPSIVQFLEKVLEKAVPKIPTLKLSLTHKLLLDYLTHCTDEQRQSMVELLKDQLPEICHSAEGSRAALLCLWSANVEHREAIVKSFHGLAIRSCQDEFARRVLFGIFDTVDDTALVNEVITSEIANNIADLVFHKFGVWVLHYLVHPRDQRVIGKGLHQMLKQGDSNCHSKKASGSRYSELFECIRDNLLTFIKANMRQMLFDKISAVLVLDTLEVPSPSDPFLREIGDSDLDECFRAIAEIATDEFVPHSPDGPSHIVQGGCARFVFRKLLQADPGRCDGHRLSDFLADLPADNLSSWTSMDCGCYTLVEVFKSGSDKARKALRRALSVAMLQNSNLSGAKSLLDLLLGKGKEQPPREHSVANGGGGGQKNPRKAAAPFSKRRERKTYQA
ncbi:hypothetical protein niasHT_026536 [Heterodera trifolii]|uniref:PUM-HD domain-containing protein n=1 Tax=Heterodera trifolii TaxID=157864 RepID=A0ABD2KSD0_9BILA